VVEDDGLLDGEWEGEREHPDELSHGVGSAHIGGLAAPSGGGLIAAEVALAQFHLLHCAFLPFAHQ
jgi:hypothetical protein